MKKPRIKQHRDLREDPQYRQKVVPMEKRQRLEELWLEEQLEELDDHNRYQPEGDGF